MSAPRDFWSRRRAAVEAEEAAAREAVAAEAEAVELAEREAKDDAEILAELDLPDPDTLKAGDDVVAFMSRAVPERLRRRALRRLWTLNPVLANLDGLNDYDDDYSVVSGEAVTTTYQVGKGMLAHIEEMARQAEASGLEPVSPDAEVAEPETPTLSAEVEETEEQPEASPPQIAPDEVSAPPRRMRFEFPEATA